MEISYILHEIQLADTIYWFKKIFFEGKLLNNTDYTTTMTCTCISGFFESGVFPLPRSSSPTWITSPLPILHFLSYKTYGFIESMIEINTNEWLRHSFFFCNYDGKNNNRRFKQTNLFTWSFNWRNIKLMFRGSLAFWWKRHILKKRQFLPPFSCFLNFVIFIYSLLFTIKINLKMNKLPHELELLNKLNDSGKYFYIKHW